MFRVYAVGGSTGIKFNGEIVLIAGRHSAQITESLVMTMNMVHTALPNASHQAIRDFTNKYFDFTKFE